MMLSHNTERPDDVNFHFCVATKPWNGNCTRMAAELWWLFYELKVKKYFQVAGAERIQRRIRLRFWAARNLFPLVYPFLRVLMPHKRQWLLRLKERGKYWKFFDSAKDTLGRRWSRSAEK